MTDKLLDRFLRYVQIDTTSDIDSTTYPSTEKQWDLLRLLADELTALGASDVTITEHGYVMATIPATTQKAGVPTVAYLAHVDTSADFSGTGVKPIVHRNYQGGAIVLPDDPNQMIDPDNPLYADLLTVIGKDVITASGTTLLGADDKAGVAVVMTLAEHLLNNPDIEHGPIRICFNPDEEVGRGVEYIDLDQLGANLAYTLDGGAIGEIDWETFSADAARVTITGVSTHPGTARKYGMVNSVNLAGKLLAALPREGISPETTDGYQGYIHPLHIEGTTAKTTVRLLLRDHNEDKLAQHGAALRAICAGLQASYPTAHIECEITHTYRNMAYWLKDDMRVVDLAREACRKVGIEPNSIPVRGGTDGSRLTEMGLPTPNIFNGMHNIHGPLEWVTLQDMEKAVEVLIELSKLWVEQGDGYAGYQPKT